MELFIKVYLILIILFTNSFLYSQENYESYLSFLEEKKFMENENWEANLLFSRVESIYLVFYDKRRREIFVQFKQDIYDDLNDKRKNHFIPGQPYFISCDFKGILRGVEFISKETLQDQNFLNKGNPVCFLKNFSPLVLNEFLY
ncbi:MAG: hypothetical protein ACK4UJ_11415 [Leptonema sp. (in: bacteria)]